MKVTVEKIPRVARWSCCLRLQVALTQEAHPADFHVCMGGFYEKMGKFVWSGATNSLVPSRS